MREPEVVVAISRAGFWEFPVRDLIVERKEEEEEGGGRGRGRKRKGEEEEDVLKVSLSVSVLSVITDDNRHIHTA